MGYENGGNDWTDGGEMKNGEVDWGSGSFNNKDTSNTSLLVSQIIEEKTDNFLLAVFLTPPYDALFAARFRKSTVTGKGINKVIDR